MKLLLALSALVAVVCANPLYLAPDRTIVPAASSQYHSQDGTGQYAYGYNHNLSSKQEIKSLDGTIRGSYNYIDSNNILQTVSYIADAGGFRVAATNLPKPVVAPIVPAHDLPQQVAETPEVIAAKSAHLAAIEEAKLQLGAINMAPIAANLPQQVQDTPEVAAAKAAHLAAIEEAKRQIGYQVIAIPTPTDLPRPVEDTPEVAKAKAEHLLAVEQAKLQSAPLFASPAQFSDPSSVPLPPPGFPNSKRIAPTVYCFYIPYIYCYVY